MRKTLLKVTAAFLLIGLCSLPAFAGDAKALAALTAAGAKVGTLKEGGSRIDIVGAKITDDVWKDLEAVGDIKAFSSSGKEFDDAQLARLAKITTIETLFFNGPGITDKGLAVLANFPNLHKYGTDHGQITGTGLSALAGDKALTAISFGGCLVNDPGMEAIGMLTQLHDVSIRHCRVGSAGFGNFAKLTELEKLQINPNFYPYYTGANFASLSNLKNLQELSIGQMIIPYENGLSHLQALKQLKKLKLESCGITDADLAKLKSDLPGIAVDFTPAPPEQVKKWDDAVANIAAKSGAGK